MIYNYTYKNFKKGLLTMTFFDDKSLKKREFMEGITIFEMGDVAEEAYLIEEGEVQIYRKKYGIKHKIATLGAGEIFGEMALIRNQKRTSSVVATKNTRIILISKETIKRKLKEADPLIQAIVHTNIRRLYKYNDETNNESAEEKTKRKARERRMS
jgi:CRP-like cAMP-binding protein